jgi:riboflavin kinase/FMN adenylyltransferase
MTQPVYLDNVVRDPDTVLTVGTFDGVHEGHKTLIERVVAAAKAEGRRSVVVSFDPHPRDILQPGANGIQLLTTLDERADMLDAMGVDQLVVIPFTRDFSLLSSEEFIRDILWKTIGMAHIVIGYDHHFGRNREGGIDALRRMGEELGFRVESVEKHEIGAVTVSSTAARNALREQGDVGLVASFLGRPYTLSGIVVHGQKRGRILGFPTANLRIHDSRKIIPKTGVYAVDVEYAGTLWRGMLNIGMRPTFRDGLAQTIETHLIGFDGDLYGQSLTVRFVDRIRDEMKFNGMEELRAQLEVDRQVCIAR